MNLQEYCDELENDIKSAYEGHITIPEAEKLAAKFLGAMLRISNELSKSDLDARMRRTGVKAVKASIYLAEATKTEKKPSDVMLTAMVDTSELVIKEQDAYDTAEVEKDKLQNYLNVFKESHLYFRNLAKSSG